MAKPTPPGKPVDKLKNAPWFPPEYEAADAYAIQALMRGEADPAAQQRALRWIIEICACTYDQSYRPGSDGARDSDFAEGKRFVGNQIVKLTKLNTAALIKKDTP